MAKRILATGYFGEGNHGDDAILLGLLQGLSGSGVDVRVMSGRPEETHRLYGVPSFSRRDLKIFDREIQAVDALVFAGGSIFQDVTSVRSAAYYGMLIKKARAAGKKVIMLGQGVGPLKTMCGKSIATKAFSACTAIAVRDPQSAATLKGLGVRGTVKLTGDLAWLLPSPEAGEVVDFQLGDLKTVGLAPRPHGKGDHVVKLFGELARLLFQAKFLPVLVELDQKEDGPLIVEIDKAMGGKVPSVRRMPTPMTVQQRIMRMDSLIAMRLHAGILASTVGVPSFMVSYDPKVNAFAQLVDLPAANVKDLTPQRLFENFLQFQKNKEIVMKSFAARCVQQREAAQQNISLLLENL
ncbi:MAG: polysaccharide pyruvyl transferase CsaB [Chthonomonas sp.]|nr:polysaccharide pyruvyl transferase CsaB [Chthonomonas sp.]